MKIIVKAKPGSRADAIEKVGSEYVVSVRALPIRGMANAAIIALLAEHFNVNRGLVRIVSGFTARVKVVEIITD